MNKFLLISLSMISLALLGASEIPEAEQDGSDAIESQLKLIAQERSGRELTRKGHQDLTRWLSQQTVETLQRALDIATNFPTIRLTQPVWATIKEQISQKLSAQEKPRKKPLRKIKSGSSRVARRRRITDEKRALIESLVDELMRVRRTSPFGQYFSQLSTQLETAVKSLTENDLPPDLWVKIKFLENEIKDIEEEKKHPYRGRS